MKYSILIDQRAIIESGLQIDLTEASIIDFISQWISSAKATTVDFDGKKYVWISHSIIINQLPILGSWIKGEFKPMQKDTVYRKMKHLVNIGLLDAHPNSKQLGMSLYAITPIFDTLRFGNKSEPSENNPMTYGFSSDDLRIKNRCPSDRNPNYKEIDNKEIEYKIIDNKEEQKQFLQTPPLEDSVLDYSLEENEIQEKKKVAQKKKEAEPIETTPYYFEVTQALLALGEKTGTKYRIPDKKTVLLRYGPYQMIIQRLKEGFTLEDLTTVVESKCSEWLSSEKMCGYLVPNTLFCKKNFENYLIASGIKPTKTSTNGKTFRDNRAEWGEWLNEAINGK